MSKTVSELHELIENSHSNICQIAAYKNGKPALEDYWHGFSSDDALNVMSVTKSVMALLIGIAKDMGLIKDTSQKVLEFFPDYTIKRGEKTIQNVTLRHLLTMTAPFKYKSEPWTKVCTSPDWTTTALDILGGRAGITGEFKYATLGIQLISGVIKSVSGMAPVEFANKYLFEPLGIPAHSCEPLLSREQMFNHLMSKQPRHNVWSADPMGINTAGWGLCLCARDMVRIGQLCLNGGSFNGRQVVSPGWIAEMTAPHVQCDERFAYMAYGFLWWLPDKGTCRFAAIGDGGNVIYADPEKNITVAVTATFKPRVFDRVQLIQEHIVPLLNE